MPPKQFGRSLTLLFILAVNALSAQHVTLLQQGKPTSIRGMCIIDNKTAWVSGSKGYVAHTADGGKTWAWQQVKGYETADFRSIEAFSDKEAIIMASGTPALILKTNDGGNTWQLKYKNTDSAYFLDAMSFADAKHGFVLGDPIKDKFLILESKDGGESWNSYNKCPSALPGQASFAASATCLRVLDHDRLVIVTGGSLAEVIISGADGDWQHHKVPVSIGEPSKGIFSVAVSGQNMVAVGGDYQHDKNKDSTACYSNDLGKTWHLAATSPSGFQSCAEYINSKTLLSTGTSGTNISTDNCATWSKFDDTGFNVCRKAKHGDLILFAGNDGRIGIYKP